MTKKDNRSGVSALYSLIPLDEFKAILGIDDRDDKISHFCLVTSTLTIEQYCKRHFLQRKFFEQIEFNGDLLLPLREYPVQKVLAVHVYGNGEILEPEFYSVVPDCGSDNDFPATLSLSPALSRYRGLTTVQTVYMSGYVIGDIPADLAAACLELASWNYSRYKGKRVGMTSYKEGLELSMPENVKALLEPYRRKCL